MRAALYSRVTTHHQQTLGLQVEAMMADIKDRGWIVAKQVEDVDSCVNDRPGRESLLRSGRRREGDVVAVWRLDRWGRSPSEDSPPPARMGWQRVITRHSSRPLVRRAARNPPRAPTPSSR
jgi:DNA invertase Pin-like site-specific DNA recombinase